MGVISAAIRPTGTMHGVKNVWVIPTTL